MVEQTVLDAAQNFTRHLSETDRRLRRTGSTVPSQEVKEQVAVEFWRVFAVAEQYQHAHPHTDLHSLKTMFRQILIPWLCRSRYFWRSIMKPHGFSGDYQMIEWMYDLEKGAGYDPTQPAIVNCLDYTFSTIHSVQCIWERRRWFAQLLQQEFGANKSLRILDVACGGARYIRDFLMTGHAPHVAITLVDQDVSAIAYATTRNLAPWLNQVTAISAPLKDAAKVLQSGVYDVVISSGLFDYLDQPTASMLLSYLLAITHKGGMVTISNFHHDDPSACCKDWGADWQLFFRDEPTIVSLFPSNTNVKTIRSANRALAYAYARK